MSEDGAVPLEPPRWQQMMGDPNVTYEEVQREFTISALCEAWEYEREYLDPIVLGVETDPSDPGELRQMMELLVDGADETVVMALMPKPKLKGKE